MVLPSIYIYVSSKNLKFDTKFNALCFRYVYAFTFVFMGPGNPVMGHPVFQGFRLKPKRYGEGSLPSTGVNGGYEQTNS